MRAGARVALYSSETHELRERRLATSTSAGRREKRQQAGSGEPVWLSAVSRGMVHVSRFSCA